MTQQFKEYNLITLFNEGEISRGIRIIKKDRLKGNTPLITAGKENYGIAEYIKTHKAKSEGECLTIDMFGNCFYRNINFFYDDNIIKLKNDKFNKSTYLYICSMLNFLPSKHGYAKQFRYKDLGNTIITLPVTSDGELDFDYMDNYIKKIEQKYILNLRGSLDDKIANLLELTQKTEDNISDEHVQILKEKIRLEYSQKEFKEFKVKDILNIKGTKSLNSGSINFSNVGINFIGRTKFNNGIQGKIDDRQLKFKPTMKNSITISQVGTIVALYQAEDYYNSQNIVSLNLKDRELNRYIGLYFVSVLNKSLLAFEGYNTPKLNDISEFVLNLPVTFDGGIDYEFMGNYVRSLENIYIYMILEYVRRKELV